MLMELFVLITGFAFGFMLTGFIMLETKLISEKHTLAFPAVLIGSTSVALIEVAFTLQPYVQWVVGFNSLGILILLLYRSSEP